MHTTHDDRPCFDRPHQGFVLKTEPMEFTNLDALPMPSSKEGSLEHWLALDEVWDPQNLGALLRSAHFLGMKPVDKNRSHDGTTMHRVHDRVGGSVGDDGLLVLQGVVVCAKNSASLSPVVSKASA
eukprot:31735-Eustigmatos_ZCMA.PRE.1